MLLAARRLPMPAKRIIVACLAAMSLHFALPAAAPAQAWVPEKGAGTVSATYSNMYVRNHVDGAGVRNPALGRIRTNIIVSSLEYGITDKLALNADVAHVASKYTGNQLLHGPKDTGSYHPTFQDAHIELRYNALRRAWVVTPFIGTTIPTHDYEVRGHSAPGRGFHELLVGVNVGRQLEGLLPDAYVHTRYSYAILGRFDGLSLNRSNAECEVGWFATRSLSLRFISAFQKTHGGIITPLEPDLEEHEREFHDRITRANVIDLGGGVGFAVSKYFRIHAAYLTNVYSRNNHAAGGFLVGISWSFSRGLGFAQSSANAPQRRLPISAQEAF